ncbi:MAG: rhamnogalacturonan acetylesterase, partial [Opitutaceae bacterium]|nr:rhamnogalacturonan acetylesterase [Opitutaceae bacterium]
LIGLAIVSGFAADTRPPKLFLIGGSTLATFPETRPVVGWGQMLPRFFKDPTQVDNRGRSGRSTKSFIDQGLWEKTLADLAPGDFLLIAFGGGNESKDDPQRRTEPRGSYRANLERFIRETRAKGATPILATAVVRREWDDQGRFVEPPSEYVVVTREVAARENAPLMELRRATVALEKSLGVEGSIALHLHLPPGAHAEHPKGVKDNTHYNAHGALKVAELAVQEIRRLGLPLQDWLR